MRKLIVPVLIVAALAAIAWQALSAKPKPQPKPPVRIKTGPMRKPKDRSTEATSYAIRTKRQAERNRLNLQAYRKWSKQHPVSASR